MIEILKAILFGIVEGVTEWLPISSTGHLILLNQFVTLNVSDEFYEMFQVVIQLGAILAVILLYFHTLNPFAPSKSREEKISTWRLWGLVVVGCIPAALVGLPLDDWFNDHFYNYVTVAVMLIVYGVAYLFIERRQSSHPSNLRDFTWRTALGIGLVQALSIIPGTSRSGSTILGGMLLGTSRKAAAEFSFFMAIPIMAGASLVKTAKFFLRGGVMTGGEWGILLVSCAVAFVVSFFTIRALVDYVRRHSFAVFGVYRIVLGVVVLGYFLIFG